MRMSAAAVELKLPTAVAGIGVGLQLLQNAATLSFVISRTVALKRLQLLLEFRQLLNAVVDVSNMRADHLVHHPELARLSVFQIGQLGDLLKTHVKQPAVTDEVKSCKVPSRVIAVIVL